ncbi:MAG: SipW-dependent-type signal peptide-containing protein [Ruminococcus sp.]|nr:SipW-dependent-type signal peptide-containing protein [Ruminococcus sp.]
MNKKRIAITSMACAMLGAVAIGGTLAYLTDTEKAENEFEITGLSIDLTETKWDNTEVAKVRPNQAVEKNPVVLNTGENDAVAFIKLESPVINGDTAPVELFNYGTGTDTSSVLAESTFGDGWKQLSKELNTDKTAYVYYFGYNEVLAAAEGSTYEDTTALFDYVELANLKNSQITGKEAQKIVVTAFAIQADDVAVDGTKLTLTADNIGAENLGKLKTAYLNDEHVTNVVSNKEADSNNVLDIAGNPLS